MCKAQFSVLTGGPGTGKTTIINAIIDGMTKGGLNVAIAAPTGRAAKRLSEATGMASQTLHRLLKYNPQTRKFTYNAENPLAGDRAR